VRRVHSGCRADCRKILPVPWLRCGCPADAAPVIAYVRRCFVGRACRAPSMSVSTEAGPMRPPRIPSCEAPLRIPAVCLW